jgi:hypothetical protein
MSMTSSNLGTHHDEHPTAHLAERTLASVAVAVAGILLLLLCAGGLANSGYAGLHLNLTHVLILAVTGALATYAGMIGSMSNERRLCLRAGIFYAALALLGMLFGSAQDHTISTIYHRGADSHLWRMVPGFLEFGARDHLLHAGLAVLFLASWLSGWLGGEGEEVMHG